MLAPSQQYAESHDYLVDEELLSTAIKEGIRKLWLCTRLKYNIDKISEKENTISGTRAIKSLWGKKWLRSIYSVH